MSVNVLNPLDKAANKHTNNPAIGAHTISQMQVKIILKIAQMRVNKMLKIGASLAMNP